MQINGVVLLQAWTELDREKSCGPLKIQCADCGVAIAGSKGRRLTMANIVTAFSWLDRGEFVYQGQLNLVLKNLKVTCDSAHNFSRTYVLKKANAV